MNQKESKWAKQIVELQNNDGTWGDFFHSLSRPTKRYPLSTEQALRRLKILGFTINDEPIRKAVDYMISCLCGERKMDDTWEKTHDWALYTQLMLSTWVKIFEPENKFALQFAHRWAKVIEKTFASGFYNDEEFIRAYIDEFSSKPNGPREIDFVVFYHMMLLQGVLTQKTENSLLDYVISKPNGIYYIYNKSISNLPEIFASVEASRYLAALEILSGYDLAKEKLGFAMEWLYINIGVNEQWDFGAKSNDGVYFPFSDSWEKAEDRKTDCTKRVTVFLQRFSI